MPLKGGLASTCGHRGCSAATQSCYPFRVGPRGGKPCPLGSTGLLSPDQRCRPAAGHALYPLMELRSAADSMNARSNSSKGPGGAVGSHSWLAACVRHIVSSAGQLRRGPLLQLVFSASGGSGSTRHRFESVPISQSVADNPENWGQFSAHVHSSGADGLLLVRPISSPEQHCVYAAASYHQAPQSASRASAPIMPLMPATACCNDVGVTGVAMPSLPAGASSAASSLVETNGDIVSGQVGACCGGNGSHDHHRQLPGQQQQQPCHGGTATTKTTFAPGSSGSNGATHYFGLVAQGRYSSEADGCWVLKTTSSDSSGAAGVCTCTHFSLTRVCLGQPLYVQLRDAWLVPQPVTDVAGSSFA